MLRVKPSAADKLESARSRTPQTRQLGNILGHPNADCESATRGEDDGHQHAPLLLRDGRTGAGDAGKHDPRQRLPPPWIDRFKI